MQIAAHPRFLALLDELEHIELPARIRREPTPEKKPPRPGVKLRHGEAAVSITFSAGSVGLITHVGGDDARAHRGRMGGEWSKQSVTRISSERSQQAYEARLADHTAMTRQGLKVAKAQGCHSRDRAAALNGQGLRTLSGQEWDRKSVARWWRTHGTG
jgi:hypothetical protein